MNPQPQDDGSGAHRPAEGVLLLAVWFGLLTGLVEVALLAVRQRVFHTFIDLGPAFVWMVPLAETLPFLAVGILLAVLGLRWRRLARPGVPAFVFAWMGLFGLLLFYPKLHPLASLVLALGLAAQVSRTVAAHPRASLRLARRTTVWMAVLVVSLGLVVHARSWLAERRAVSELPPATPGAPNVLLIVLDTVRAQSVSLDGYPRPTTPNLERMAETGVRFTRAVAAAPWTLPSHSSLFTGRWPHELTADWETPLDATYPTLAEVFRARGYRTGGFVANTLYVSYEQGLNRGFVHFEDFEVSPQDLVASSSLASRLYKRLGFRFEWKPAPEVWGGLLGWLDGSRSERPFFGFLNFMEAHRRPCLAPKPFDTKFGPTRIHTTLLQDILGTSIKVERKHSRILQNAYEACIGYLDQEVGRLFDALERRGLLHNTVIIVTSDHGEQFGEHGLFSHANSLYMQLLHVPLLIWFPSKLPRGLTVDDEVTLRDLAATVLDVAGVQGRTLLPGTSLARYWRDPGRGNAPNGDILLSEVSKGIRRPPSEPVSRGDMRSLVIGGQHYIKNGDGVEELYAWHEDAGEVHNLVDSSEARSWLPQFRAVLAGAVPPTEGRGEPSRNSGRASSRPALPADWRALEAAMPSGLAATSTGRRSDDPR